DVACDRCTLSANHGGVFGDAAESLPQIARSADEGNREGMLIDVMSFVGGGEHFGFVNVVDAQLLQNLRLGEVSDAALGHNWNRHRGHDLANFLGRCHAYYVAFSADLRVYALVGYLIHASAF